MNRISIALGMVILASISGCSSISEQQCQRGDWFDIGFDHGREGYSVTRGKDIIYECLDYAVRPNLADYKRGHKEGLKDYCQSENAFQLGLRGERYNGICGSEDFRLAWQQGYDRYTITQRRYAIDSRIASIESQLKNISYRLHTEDLDSKQRKELFHQRHRLEHEQDDLRHERASLPVIPPTSPLYK
ncbi:DUF2799 domain-containing protein [Pseudoalteromonas sp. GB56]